MKHIVSIILLILTLEVVVPAQSTDVMGWQDARWNMNESEILAKFGGQLVKLQEPEKFKDAYVNYVISPYSIGTGKYTVRFQMNNESMKLDQVLIRLDQMDSKIPNELYFNQLDSLLTEKYKDPTWKNDRRGSTIKLERKWVFPTTTISLSYLWMDVINLLTITYSPTKKSEAEKL